MILIRCSSGLLIERSKHTSILHTFYCLNLFIFLTYNVILFEENMCRDLWHRRVATYQFTSLNWKQPLCRSTPGRIVRGWFAQTGLFCYQPPLGVS